MPLNLGLSDVSSRLDSGGEFLAGYPTGGVCMPFGALHLEACVCSVTREVNLNRLAIVVGITCRGHVTGVPTIRVLLCRLQ